MKLLLNEVAWPAKKYTQEPKYDTFKGFLAYLFSISYWFILMAFVQMISSCSRANDKAVYDIYTSISKMTLYQLQVSNIGFL